MPFAILLAAALMCQSPSPADAPQQEAAYLAEGIHRELAARRASKLRRVEYQIEFELSEGMSEARGSLRLLFHCSRSDEDLVLDWGGDPLQKLAINGRPIEGARRVHNHIVIPAALVITGRNTITTDFRAKVAKSGSPLTSYRDQADGKHYYYTLVVPADCHRVIPCFDQPNLKARFGLELTIPESWNAVANDLEIGETQALERGRKRMRFDARDVLPSYLFAFAAGPFAIIEGPKLRIAGDPSSGSAMRIFVRASKKKALEAERIFAMHLDSLRWYEAKFSRPYPFSKLDIVLYPGFPYGGMEHAGAIFYRESSLVFDHKPSKLELLRRSTLVYHEVAHQWFGNLVTMPWFDELWLKEGFATWASYAVMEVLEPESRSWLRFHQRIKPAALSVDASPGTVPVFQALANLAHAKSAYGPIVYNKATAVLRELETRLGSPVFYAGVSKLLADFAYGNASWRDLMACLEAAGARDLAKWSRRWIDSPGLPRIQIGIESGDDGRVKRASVDQRSAQGWLSEAWPLKVEVLARTDQGVERHAVDCSTPSQRIASLEGKARPKWLLANANDAACGLFIPDPKSLETLPLALKERDPELEDPLLRAIAIRGLEDAMRDALLDPRVFVEVGLIELERDRDPLNLARLLGSVETAIVRYLRGIDRSQRRERLARILHDILTDDVAQEVELLALRSFARLARSEGDLAYLDALARGDRTSAGLVLGTQDRFLCGAALLATGDASLLEHLRENVKGDFAKYDYQASAANADPKAKAAIFAGYLEEGETPEQWISGSLSYFHWSGQRAVTLPYLRRALDAVLWVKEKRKIFFMPAWVNAFVNGHASKEAVDIVEAFLEEREGLPIDVQRKIRQSLDELKRSVRIVEAYPGG